MLLRLLQRPLRLHYEAESHVSAPLRSSGVRPGPVLGPFEAASAQSCDGEEVGSKDWRPTTYPLLL